MQQRSASIEERNLHSCHDTKWRLHVSPDTERKGYSEKEVNLKKKLLRPSRCTFNVAKARKETLLIEWVALWIPRTFKATQFNAHRVREEYRKKLFNFAYMLRNCAWVRCYTGLSCVRLHQNALKNKPEKFRASLDFAGAVLYEHHKNETLRSYSFVPRIQRFRFTGNQYSSKLTHLHVLGQKGQKWFLACDTNLKQCNMFSNWYAPNSSFRFLHWHSMGITRPIPTASSGWVAPPATRWIPLPTQYPHYRNEPYGVSLENTWYAINPVVIGNPAAYT